MRKRPAFAPTAGGLIFEFRDKIDVYIVCFVITFLVKITLLPFGHFAAALHDHFDGYSTSNDIIPAIKQEGKGSLHCSM